MAKFPLDGVWSFLHVSNDAQHPAEVRPITVPGVWQAQFRDLCMSAGIGIFLREFTLAEEWLGMCLPPLRRGVPSCPGVDRRNDMWESTRVAFSRFLLM